MTVSYTHLDVYKRQEEATSKANDNADLETYEQKGTNDYKAGTQKWVDIPNDPEDITGGYLLELELGERYKDETSGFVTTGGQAVTMKCPECVSENQIKYISEFYQNMENALYSKDGYTTDSKGERHALSDYIDIESLARMYLLQEFSMNLDSGITSFYLYKDLSLIHIWNDSSIPFPVSATVKTTLFFMRTADTVTFPSV